MQRVKDTLFSYSQEQNDFDTARKEWLHKEGRVYDLSEEGEKAGNWFSADTRACELCEHPNIRWAFEIVNLENDNTLQIGSECINKFISVDENGIIINDPFSKQKYTSKQIDFIKSLNRVKKDLRKSVSPSLFEKVKGDLTNWEQNFYSDILRKKNLSDKQLACKIAINKKLTKQ